MFSQRNIYFKNIYSEVKRLCIAVQISRINCYSTTNYEPKALRRLKAISTRSTVQYYVDKKRVNVFGGNGGDGCISFLAAWCNDHAGPDGGDGGHGGHVIFRASGHIKNLNHCLPVLKANHGEKGYNKDCDGKNAKHTVIPVPIGTIIKNENGMVIGDLESDGMLFVGARGGAGGRGNKFFLSDLEQAPEVAEVGAEGECKTYELELRSMAHVGLIGFPNAGKSTLLRCVSRARPRVAPYPFTTLHPHIGMVPYDDYEQVADLPGLIPGSHKNYGLGIQFLQHAERCSGLLYIIDASVDEPWKQWEILQFELSKFSKTLADQTKYIVANKMDLPESQKNLPQLKKYFKDFEFIPISAKIGTNITSLLKVIRTIYNRSVFYEKQYK